MSLVKILFLSACLVGVCWAGARVEGKITLPPAKPASGSAASARYQIKASSAPAAPEPVQAVVYLEGDFPKDKPVDVSAAEMGQRKFQFSQGVLPIQKGGKVEFPNYDDDYHNVFSYSKAKRFDLGRYRKEEKPAAQVFDKPGVVKLFCEIHEHMRATILVLDTPYFSKADPAGNFKLDNLPAGKFTLKVWLDEKTILEKPVELKDGETLKVDFGN